jgi:hypothetical protein
MSEANTAEGIRIISRAAISFMCVLLVSVMAQNGASAWLLKKKPSVELHASTTSITYPCPPNGHSISRSCPFTAEHQIGLTVITKDFNKQSIYAYTVTGGRVVGEGSKVAWDLSEVGPGFYAATVEVHDNKKHRALSTVNVTIQNCGDCVISDFPCPTIVVTCFDEVKAGTPITCNVVFGPATQPAKVTYEWSARDSSGEDLSGLISGKATSISIPTNGLGGKTVTAKVEIKGLEAYCWRTASSSTAVKP